MGKAKPKTQKYIERTILMSDGTVRKEYIKMPEQNETEPSGTQAKTRDPPASTSTAPPSGPGFASANPQPFPSTAGGGSPNFRPQEAKDTFPSHSQPKVKVVYRTNTSAAEQPPSHQPTPQASAGNNVYRTRYVYRL